MKHKILFFIPHLSGGGAERVAVNIMNQLDSKKYEVYLVILNRKHCEIIDIVSPSVKLIELGVDKTIISVLKLRNVISTINPHFLFSTLIRSHIAVDLALKFLKNKPKVIYRSPNSPKLLIENKQLSGLTKYLLDHSYRRADIVLAQTPEMKKELESYHKVSINKITVMLNPINREYINRSIESENNPFDCRLINVVAAGRLIYQKGFDILIESFSEVIKNNKKFRLFIVGEDVCNEKEKYLNIARNLGISDYVCFLGFQNNPYKYFYFSDLYVLSSRWEGLPNTVLENLYLKKPIIATKCIPFMNELISDGNNGILVDVNNVSELSRAILNYKEINTDYKSIDFNTSSLVNILTRFTQQM
ncbi:glycosyltransferase [Vibrio breoganii]|uniref:glycosyltransferase n=1 Tax=Vibrio breoganii TaxID=553239 RepID=UPI000C83AF4A|nr:glycosyltransferase [Vibrio breoganii]PML94606.1 hypothetical protein BCT64_11015 [Vibrio breoganii]PMN72792.1 hypothetical protein BCT28_16830 [Vibrio breoganii]